MVDDAHYGASLFLWVGGIGFLIIFALPIFFVPLRWARAFRWKVPSETPLTVYFARCLGGLALALVYFVLRAAPAPASHPETMLHVAVASLLMTVVHVWGALRRQQPWTEDAEILLYAALSVAGFYFYEGL